MATFMFDTNICIYLMKRQPPAVVERFERLHVGDVIMSSLTYAELEYGVIASSAPSSARDALRALTGFIDVVSFDTAAAVAYGPVRAATRERKRDAIDKLIAAHAIALGVTLVTNNERDFQGYPGLCIENWVF